MGIILSTKILFSSLKLIAMGFFDQMKQLTEMKQKMDEVKKRLDVVEVSSESDFVKVTVNGNRRIKEIKVLRSDDKISLEAHLKNSINEALEKADSITQTEFAAVTKGMFPNMPF